MSSRSADVIDLQSYRAMRGMGPAAAAEEPAASAFPPIAMVAWVPVWFMPFAFVSMLMAKT